MKILLGVLGIAVCRVGMSLKLDEGWGQGRHCI